MRKFGDDPSAMLSLSPPLGIRQNGRSSAALAQTKQHRCLARRLWSAQKTGCRSSAALAQTKQHRCLARRLRSAQKTGCSRIPGAAVWGQPCGSSGSPAPGRHGHCGPIRACADTVSRPEERHVRLPVRRCWQSLGASACCRLGAPSEVFTSSQQGGEEG